MKSDQSKTKTELIQELQLLQKRINTQDITEQKGVKKKLWESEERYNTLFEESRDAIFVSSLDGSSFDFNQAAEEMLGYSRGELLSLSMEDLYANKEDRLQFRKIIESQGYVKDYELQLRKKDGSVIDCLNSATLRRDMDGNIIGYQGIIRNITERKQAEVELQEANTFLRNILESSTSVSIISTDWEGNILYWNQGAEKIFGYKSEEIVGHKKIGILYPDDEEETLKIVKDMRSFIQKSKKGTSCEIVEVTKDGRKLWAHLTLSPRLNQNGELIGILGIGEDITEHKRAESELKVSEQKYRDAVENASDLIFMNDYSGNFKFVNTVSEKMTEYTKDELIRMNYAELTHPDDVEKTRRLYEEQFKTRSKEIKFENRFVTKSGKIKWLWVHSTLIMEGDYLVGWQNIGRDITDRKQAEKALQESEAKYKEIATSIPGVVYQFMVKKNGSYAFPYVDENCEKFFHHKAKAVVADPNLIFNMVPPDELQSFIDSIEESARTLKEWRHDFRVVLPEGQERWFEGRSVPHLLQSGEPFWNGVVTDITERKQAEENLKKSEERYKHLSNELETIFDNLPALVFYKDTENRFIRVNKYVADAYEMTKNELEGVNLSDIHTKDDAQAYWDDDLEVINSGKPKLDIEESWETAEGLKWVNTSKIPFIDENGDIIGIIGISLDITERKQAEAMQASIYRISEAVHSAQNLESLFTLIHDIVGDLMSAKNFYIALYDPASKILSFPYFVDEYDDVPAPKKFSKGLTEYVLRKGKPLLASPEVFKELVKKGEVEQIGTPSIDWLGIPLKTKNKTIGILVTQSYTKGIRFGKEEKDILMFVSSQVAMAIEQKRAEEEIKSAQKYARNLIESSLDMVISVDKKRRIVEFNQAAEKTFGYSKVKVMGKHINILYANPAEGLEAHKTTRQSGQFYGEIQNKRKNGETFTSFLSSSILKDENNEFLGVMGVSRDITERIKARKELETALEKAQEGERVKSLFMANMSHEIRTPLNAILGFTDILETSTSHLVSEEEKGFFDTIKHSGNRLMETVHEILDISQIEAGTYDLKIEPFDFAKLVKNLVPEFQTMADKKGLKMKYKSALNSAFIKADQNGVSQAICNIIDNAIKYTKQGKITVSLEQKAKQYILTIQDTGIGISEEYLENLFDAFTQESEGYTKKYQGIGLGMAIAKHHLDISQVGIDVESSKDVGTTFTLTFKPDKKRIPEKPVEKEEAKVKPTAEPVEKQQVLLVEDDPNSQKLIEFFLMGQYNICLAVSVDEAKQQLKKCPVDLILLDLSLIANEDGLDLVRWMRKTKTWKKTPVIATTAHAFTTDQNNCMAAGCDDYISKPIKRELLLEKISKYA